MNPPSSLPASVNHYENFPVASWLCPAHLRAPIAAIYWFARTADDIADEGTAPAAERLQALARYRQALADCFTPTVQRPETAPPAGHPPAAWPEVFGPLRAAIEAHGLPRDLLEALLSAFEQDVAHTRDARGYTHRVELLDYCARSASPVGRLLLHLYGISDDASLLQSDCICSALQLINFWQDLSLDLPRGRYYLPAEDLLHCGMDPAAPATWAAHPRARELVARQVRWARALMLQGAPLALRVPGRAGWELRLVVQGGLRILERIEAIDHASFTRRPAIGGADIVRMLWRAFWM